MEKTKNQECCPSFRKKSIQIIKLHPDAVIPSYKSEFSAGCDLYTVEDSVLEPFTVYLIRTGIAVSIPPDLHGEIRLRSSISLQGVFIPNAPGTIDSDYRGEIKIPLRFFPSDLDSVSFKITKGTRIAQLVLVPYVQASFEEVSELSESVRGSGGFGSTGLF